MPQAIFTVGVPASGKSTWAREYSALYKVPIVCRDDIRVMQGLKHGENEKLVTQVQRALMEGLIAEGKDFIVADTNVNKDLRESLVKFCHQRGCDVNLVVFNISLDEAVARDEAREASVGRDVIKRMYDSLQSQNVQPELLMYPRPDAYNHAGDVKPYAIIADIDGTVARHVNRSPYDYTKVGDDEYIEDVVRVLNTLSYHHEIVFVSGRDDSCEAETRKWLDKRFTGYSLFMRRTGDLRPDYVIKNEIYDREVIPRYNIQMVFDDREQVVTHLRLRGITVAQVAPGRF